MVEKTNGNPNQEVVNGHQIDGNDHGKDIVKIYVNDVAVPIHRGRRTVSEIKAVGNVPTADILYQMPNYEVALNDNESITIKGDERFKSSAPSGGSS